VDANSDEPKPSSADAAVGCIAIVVGALLLLLFISSVATMFHSSLYSVLSAADRWATLIANLVVVFVTFPAFRVTKDRAFLFLAIGALSFAYGTLFALLVGIKPPVVSPMKWSHTDVQLYYVMRCAVDVVGLTSYVWGVALVTRRARLRHAEKVLTTAAAKPNYC